jgi:uncharacterized glyoxalase superfamily protein PhnB
MSGKSTKSPNRAAPQKSAASSVRKRKQPESLRGRSLMAALTVKDIKASVAWYRDVLGFTVGNHYDNEGKLFAVELTAGAVEFVLNQDDGAHGLDRVKGEGMSFQIMTAQNVDGLAANAVANGATLITPPMTMPWGARIFRVRDPDGFKLVISSER